MASLTGVFSGIDSTVLIADMMKSYQASIDRLNQQKTQYQSKKTAVSGLQTSLQNFQSIVDTLRDSTKLRSVSASSSNDQVATAYSTSGASEGVHQIEVNRLATAERQVHAGVRQREAWASNITVATTDSEFLSADAISDNAGDSYRFSFQFGSESQVSVDLSQYDQTGVSLKQMVDAINTQAGYTAAVAVAVNGQYKLRLQAQNVGTAALTVGGAGSVDAMNSLDDFARTCQGGAGTQNSLVGAGQFVYSYGGTKRTILTTADTTLANLADLINADSLNPGVSASVLQYDSGDGAAYHLVLAGKDSGASHTIAIDGTAVTGTTLDGTNGTIDFRQGSFLKTQTAQNSQVRVDGYPSGSAWIERDSNSIDDVVPGLTLTLQSLGSTTISTSRDTSQLQNSLQNLVSAYNENVTNLKQYTGYDATNKVAGLLQGDSLVTTILDSARASLVGVPAGFDGGNSNSITLASQIGLEMDKDGQLTFDTKIFSSAVDKDYDGVLKVIGATGTGSSDNAAVQFSSAMSSTKAGVYNVKITYDANGNATAWIKGSGDADYTRQMTVNGNQLTGVLGNAEQGLSLTTAWNSSQGAYTTYATIRVQEGFAGSMYDADAAILDPTTGRFATQISQYDSQMSQLDTQIAAKQRAFDQKQEMLKQKFARLEATLSQLDSQKASLDQMAQAQNNSNKN